MYHDVTNVCNRYINNKQLYQKYFCDIFVINRYLQTMTKVQLEVPEDLHLKVRQEQLRIEIEEKQKLTLKEVYERIIREALSTK